MYANTLAAAAALIGAANAHFFISQPVPIPGTNSKSPLDPSGSDFPCQGADLSGGQVTNMAVGSSQPLKFDLGTSGGFGANWAVHGGGSCQISITYETDKAKQKDPNNWKVIHSFVGGCPTDTLLNLDTNPKGAVACDGSNGPDCVKQDLTFQIPPEVKDGTAILAWTWFNNVGNREMYMNCAKVSFSGGSNQVDTLPGMFAANIGKDCATTAYHNTDFPSPGKYITKGTQNYPLQAPVGSACASGPGSGTAASSGSTGNTGSGSTGNTGSGSTGNTGSSSANTGSNGSPQTTTAAAAPAATTTGSTRGKGRNKNNNSAQVFAEGAATTLTTKVAAAAATKAASVPSPKAAAASGNQSSGSCSGGAVACSSNGFYCISESSFGICSGGCAVPQVMAPGTMCSGGAVSRIARRHLHRRSHH